MAQHEGDTIVESTDGGTTWAQVTLSGSMNGGGGTDFIWFIDTCTAPNTPSGCAGTPGTHSSGGTANTWIWMAQSNGGASGTWRTANGGTTWTEVSTNEHPHGAAQIYQVGSSNNRIDGFSVNGVVYMAGVFAAGGFGIQRSTDYGVTWTHVGNGIARDNMAGTSGFIYGMDGGAVGLGVNANSGFELGAQPGTGTFSTPTVPAGLYQASAQFAVVNDGTHNILLCACWGAGLWRYIEP
jgi:hypothetical protein